MAAQQRTTASIAVTASCQWQGAEPNLRVEVRNDGTAPAAIVLGFTPAGTQTHVVNSMRVSVIRPATSATEEYVYINPKFAAFNGRSDPWVVSIAPGATYEVDVPLKGFISGLTYALLDPVVANGGRLILQSRPAKSSAAVWSGTVEAPIQECG
jgi:hypothetical protein